MSIIPHKVWYRNEGWREWLMDYREPDTETERYVILGLGRAGTTFLIQLLTRLGFDTGAEPYNEPVNKKVRAGFELQGIDESGIVDDILVRSPQVIKNPMMSFFIDGLLKKKTVPVKHIILPVRNIRETVMSREAVGLYLLREYKDMNVQQKIPEYYTILGKIVESCTLNNTPVTTIAFPHMVKDSDYLRDKLRLIFGKDERLEYTKFSKEFVKLAKPDIIKTRLIKEDYEQ